jgi:mannose-6-phosphate isomerase-like protein (cupin superfamily)
MKDLLDDTQERPLWNGADYRTILPAAETGGAMSIVDAIHEPGTGPGRHIHTTHDEIFVVLAGRLRFAVGDTIIDRGPGGAVFVPRGTDHTFQVLGHETSRFLVIYTPPGFEGFLDNWISHRWRLPEDMATVSEAAERTGMVLTGPPITA